LKFQFLTANKITYQLFIPPRLQASSVIMGHWELGIGYWVLGVSLVDWQLHCRVSLRSHQIVSVVIWSDGNATLKFLEKIIASIS
jgi:hypothetical protein